MKMKRTNCYGVSRTRDKKCHIVKRELKDYVMCIHAQVGGNMMVLVAEEYETEDTEGTEKG